jgi:hypothetical protein
MRRGVYPGSFNPPTRAHLAIVEAARDRHDLGVVDLVVSRVAIGKPDPPGPTFDERIAVLEALAERVGFVGVVVSDRQLITELAEGYDVVIMGADKWHQVNDPAYYDDSAAARDVAVARLPAVAVVPRPPFEVPDDLRLEVIGDWSTASSTAARNGAIELMVDEAAELTRVRGGWVRSPAG